MVKKIKDRLQNKKGFTLVELIVVIVIILILAAVLVPNVTRYVGQAKKATFQEEASAYLTEVQSYAAEKFATKDIDIVATDFTNASPTYTLTNFKASGASATDSFIIASSTLGNTCAAEASKDKVIRVKVKNGAIEEFGYRNKQYNVVWTQSGGWKDINTN